jgi:hypothetical protein
MRNGIDVSASSGALLLPEPLYMSPLGGAYQLGVVCHPIHLQCYIYHAFPLIFLSWSILPGSI